MTEPNMMEGQVGALTGQGELDLRRLVLRIRLLRFDAAADSDAAIRIFRRCRAS